MFVGIAGGAFLYDPRFGLLGFAVLIFYSILDSTDGQLARMTGQVTELGRVLDGVIGYAVYVAIYASITAGLLQRGASNGVLILMLLAAISNIAQAQRYEYFRHHYKMIALKGQIENEDPARVNSAWIGWMFRGYLTVQGMLNGLHNRVVSTIAARSSNGIVREEDRLRYREFFRGPVRGWNLLGDNWRFYAIGLAACFQRTELFFYAVLLPLNLTLLALLIWQRKVDRNFLRAELA